MADELEEDILRSLRRITRAIDLHSRKLANAYGLTGPQLVCLRTIARAQPMTPSVLAREVSLSQATITGIIDRLVARQLVTRKRSETDRRQVSVTATKAGQDMIATAPSPLQEQFAESLASLSPEEAEIIRVTLGKVASMMGGGELDAAPVLTATAEPEDILTDPEDMAGAETAEKETVD